MGIEGWEAARRDKADEQKTGGRLMQGRSIEPIRPRWEGHPCPRNATGEGHMLRLQEVKVQDGYRLWLRYSDGTEGVVDLSDLAGRGVFRAWRESGCFEAVRIDDAGALQWPGGLDLCPHALYLRLTGKAPEDVFPSLRTAGVDA